MDRPPMELCVTGLLRTCKRINMEACAVLYGWNNFAFDGGLVKYRDCYTCRSCGRKENKWNHGPNDNYYDGIAFAYMYDFLSHIGKENRLRIRSLQITFCASNFYFKNPKRKGERSDLAQAIPTESSYVERALELLSFGHNLLTVTIKLNDRSYCSRRGLRFDEGFDKEDLRRASKLCYMLFRASSQSKLIQQLEKIQGIDRLFIEFYNNYVNLDFKEIRLEQVMQRKANDDLNASNSEI